MSREVTVLGAGIVGICTALSLLERGVTVRVIDRGDPGQETSSGNAGVISPWSILPQALPGTWRQIPKLMFGPHRALSIRMAAWPKMVPWGLQFLKHGRLDNVTRTADAMEILCGPSIDLYRRHLQGTGAEELVQDSYYVHAFRNGDNANLDAIDYRIRREKGADVVLADHSELRRLEPALSSKYEAAILIKGQARALSPGRIGQVLADKVRKLGGDIVQRDIKSLQRSEDGWTIDCGSASFFARAVVLSLGAWSPKLLEPLGIKMPLMVERGYHVEFPTPEIELRHSIMDMDAKVVASSMETGLRIAGQADFAPVDAASDPGKKTLIERAARAMFPDLNTNDPKFWMGRRPSFPDSLPAIGELPHMDGLMCNFGHSHYGLMMAPKSGEIVADLLVGPPQNTNLAAIAPTRFSTGFLKRYFA
ncbi:MAG: FAD-binding oxidoreductase [Stappiaceae bacterium]